MKKILLDTSFILTCVRNKIDLFEELFLEGYKIIIPVQVLDEIKKFEKSKSEARIALKILERDFYENPDFGAVRKNGTVDNKIINYAKENPHTVIATLDRGIKKKIQNDLMVIRGKKKLEVI